MPPFHPVPAQPDWPAQERAVLAWWQATDAFGKLTRQNAGGPIWSFQDGPITANNPMGVHHAWGRTYKDAWQRFFAMQGRDQRWQNGFDCQGLWVEVEVEKELGFTSKRDIEGYGIDAFVRRCKERVLRMAALQTEQSIRLGMWMHWDDPDALRWLADRIDLPEPLPVPTPSGPVTGTVEALVGKLGHAPWHGSYFTFADLNNYLIWRFLKECHARGWVYKGRDVMPWCFRCGTGLSHHEIVTEGYREMTHRSPVVRFQLVDQPGASLLVWTTTPWTLTSNVAAAVGPDLTYLKVRLGDEVFYLAEGVAARVLNGKRDVDWTVEGRLQGSELVGWRYRGPFDALPAQAATRELHRVIPWSEVGADEGTGIVHIAPGCGAEDFALGRAFGLPAIAPLDESGRFLPGFDWLTGRHALEVADEVIAHLKTAGLLYSAAPYTHRYPVCWRCQSELVFRLVDEWFIRMGELFDKPRDEVTEAEKASSLRHQMMDVVDDVNWIPAFGREREQDWLRNMDDWMISKKRYWGLALPIWTCAACGWFDVIGGHEELEARATGGWETFEGHPPHRPHVDAVTIACPECGGTARRIPDVGNPWLDAGIVPLSTLPDTADREKWFPADFITESFPGQFRNWFYSMLAMGTVLKQAAPFKNVLGFATLLAEDGSEMHKSRGNSIEFNAAADQMGADVMRWMYMAQRPEQNLKFGYGPSGEVRRRFFIPLWNVYAFFVQYANVADGWRPDSQARADDSRSTLKGPQGQSVDSQTHSADHELDRWIRIRLNALVGLVTDHMTDFDAHRATSEIEAFVEDLSNWYVRRSRRRFWEGDPAALDTLHVVLTTLVKLVAPMIPFTAEAMYRNLAHGASLDEADDVGTGGVEGAGEADGLQRGVDVDLSDSPESVHHARWPAATPLTAEDRGLLEDMALVVRLAALGRAARSAADVKLRQPLALATLAVRTPAEAAAVERLAEHLTEELNVKRLEIVRDQGTLVDYSLRPVLPKLGPRLGKSVPAIREALQRADAAVVAAKVAAGEPVALTLADGTELTLAADEVEVVASARAGLATAEAGGYVVGIQTQLTPELLHEGLVRDLVRLVQQLRKDSGLAITDRIALTVDAGEPVRTAVEAFAAYLTGETLATSLVYGPPAEGAVGTAVAEVEGVGVTVGLQLRIEPTDTRMETERAR